MSQHFKKLAFTPHKDNLFFLKQRVTCAFFDVHSGYFLYLLPSPTFYLLMSFRNPIIVSKNIWHAFNCQGRVQKSFSASFRIYTPSYLQLSSSSAAVLARDVGIACLVPPLKLIEQLLLSQLFFIALLANF